MATGENSGTWGTKTNTNLGTLLEQAIVGYDTVTISDDPANPTTLTMPDGVSSVTRSYVLELTGTLNANRNLIVPALEKSYVIYNNTVNGYSVTVKVSGQTGVTVLNGKKAIVVNDGTDVREVFNYPLASPSFDGNVVITSNSSSNALRITQTGSGNALVVEDSTNPDATPFVVTADGTVAVGATSGTGSEKLYIASDTGLGITGNSSGSSSSAIRHLRAKGTVASPTTVASGDTTSLFQSYGYDGSSFVEATRITAAVDGTPGSSDMPGRIVFSTTADGASSVTERVRIDSAGLVTVTGTQLINANTSTNALRITQTGTGNAFIVEDSSNPDSSPFVINADGTVIVGKENSTNLAASGAVQIIASQAISRAAAAPQENFYRVNTSFASPSIIASGDTLGQTQYLGYDGANAVAAASIQAAVDGTPGTNDMPGRLVFSTTADGASTVTERLRIGSAGQFGIAGANYGTSGQVLTSGGASAAPSWTSLPRTVFIGAGVASGSNFVTFTSIPVYTTLLAVVCVGNNDSTGTLTSSLQLSSTNGSSWGSSRTIVTATDKRFVANGSVTVSNTGTVASKTITPAIVTQEFSYSTTATESTITGVIDAIRFTTGNTDAYISVTLYGIP